MHEGARRLLHLFHRHAPAVVQVLAFTALGHLGTGATGHRRHHGIRHTLLLGEVMEAVSDPVHGHGANNPGLHSHLPPDVVDRGSNVIGGMGLAGQ